MKIVEGNRISTGKMKMAGGKGSMVATVVLASMAGLTAVRAAGIPTIIGSEASMPGAPTLQTAVSAERFSPQVKGCLERAAAMSDAGNYAGVIDQIGMISTQQSVLTGSEAELCAFLLAEAYYNLGEERSVHMLEDFARAYPASALAVKSRLLAGDYWFFRHDWPNALEAYMEVDLSRLNHDDRLLYTYRRVLSMIKTGHFREARPLVSRLRGEKGYADAYNFYNAYLDYIDGKFSKAYEGFSRVSPGIDGMDAQFYMAQIDYSRGEYGKVAMLGEGIRKRGVDPELRPELDRIVGLSLFKTGHRREAASYLQQYLHTTEGSPSGEALYALGSIEYEEGDYAAAAERFASLTDFNNEVGQGAWLYLGQCYLREGNPTSAVIAFEKASKLNYDPEVGETALFNYVTAVTKGGKVPFSSSSDMLREFVERYPDSEYRPEVESYLASAYYNDRAYAKALRCIDNIPHPSAEVLAMRQKVLYALGVETMTNGKASLAVPYLEEASQSRADKGLATQSSLWLGDAYFALSRYSDAQRAYERFLREDRSDLNRSLGYYNLGYAKYKLKNYAGAASDFAKAVAKGGTLNERMVLDAKLMRADCLYYTGQYGESKALFSEVVSAGADGADYALYRRAILHGLAGDNKSKLSDLRSVGSNYPESRWLSKALLEEAHLHEEQGRSDLAADAYKKRLSVTADVDIDELLRMAEAMHAAGRWNDLLEVTSRIRSVGGLEADELSDISLYEADALAETGRKVEAEEIYVQLSQTPTSLAGSKASVALAESMLSRRDFEGARRLMEEFTEQGTPHSYWLARGFVALADAYKGLGETSLAREYLLSLRDNYPGGEADIESMISSRLKKWK